MQIEIKILNSLITDKLPKYATPGSAGLDLVACIEQEKKLLPDTTKMIPTGIAIHIGNAQYAGLILPRSGLGHKHGIVLGNLVGLIDSDYQGEVKLSLWNRSNTTYIIKPYERLAQLVIIPVIQTKFTIVQEFVYSQRGLGGFGSTDSNKDDVP